MLLYSLHPREIRRQSSSTRCGSVKLLFLVPAPRGKPERRMKKMEQRSGTFFRDSLHIMHCESALRTAEAAAQQQHSSGGGSDVAATDEKDEHGYTGEPFHFVLALSRNLKRTSADTPRSLLLTTAVLLCR